MATPIILFDNRFLDGTPTATSTAPGFSVLNIRDGKTYTHWRAVGAGANFITVDCGVARSADCLAIIGHNLGTANASVFVETSTDNASWTDRFPRFIPSSDRALFVTFPLTFARFWRFGTVTTTAIPFLAVVMLGNRLTFPFPPDTPYIPCRESIEAESAIGKTGQILGSVMRFKPIEISARFSNLTRAWVMNNFMPFWNSHASNLRPFFWAWDITAFPDMVFFVTIDKESSFEMPMSILPFIDSIELNMKGVMEI
ncbi:MAG: hypothetical protein DDT23_01261 [candidate division WS2 bacterium]|nr:hypothetical protein [Candidatus Lithacetigena glycinireducens]